MTTPIHIDIASESARRALEERLEKTHSIRRAPATQRELVYLDSFDWRLFAKGRVLEAHSEEHGWRLIDRPFAAGETRRGALLTSLPRWPAEFPRGTLRDRLDDALENRALLPLAREVAQLTPISRIDREGKTVLRLELLEIAYADGDGRETGITKRTLRAIPVRGYDSEARALRDLIADIDGITVSDKDPMQLAVEALGREPGDYSSKINLKLIADAPAEHELARILLHLLETMRANEAGVQARLDVEFLHDLRVAVRRTRSALSQVKGVFVKDDIARFKDDFAWLGRFTGAARDLDVHLEELPAHTGQLPEELRAALDPLRELLELRNEAAYSALNDALTSARYRNLCTDWRHFIVTVLEGRLHQHGARGLSPMAEVADRRLLKTYATVIAEGSAIDDTSPPEALHDLRKTCKKLRYLLEFFRSLYPEKTFNRSIKTLKTLQEVLGTYQDAHVQIETLLEMSDSLGERPPRRTLMALGMLIEQAQQRQAEARAQFAERFAAFSAPDEQSRFYALCHDTKTTKKKVQAA